METLRFYKGIKGKLPYFSFWLSFLILSSFVMADIANQVVRWKLTVPLLSSGIENYKRKIASKEPKRSLFNILSRESQTEGTQEMGVEPSLANLKLVGTAVGKDGDSYAFFEDRSKGEQIALREGETILEDAVIKKVNRGRILLSVKGVDVPMEISYEEEEGKETDKPIPSPPETQSSGLNRTLDRREVENAMKDLNRVMTESRAVPYIVGGKAQGFRIFSIKPGSIYTKVGLINGDIIQRINGVELDSPEKAYYLFQQLRDESMVTLDILRRGKTVTLPVEIR